MLHVKCWHSCATLQSQITLIFAYFVSHVCILVYQDAMFYNFTLSVSKYRCLLLALEWLERHYFNGTKVQWLSLMHGNGCQQAFSCSTTIRALSLVSGWPASYPAELQCCQVSHLWGWQHVSIPKIPGMGADTKRLMHATYSQVCHHWLEVSCVHSHRFGSNQINCNPVAPVPFVLTLHEDVHTKTSE